MYTHMRVEVVEGFEIRYFGFFYFVSKQFRAFLGIFFISEIFPLTTYLFKSHTNIYYYFNLCKIFTFLLKKAFKPRLRM